MIAALFPIALSFAVAPGWTVPLLTIALFVTLELFSNNVLEPWLYGSSTGLSPVAVLVAVVVWTTLWGPVGLLLRRPLPCVWWCSGGMCRNSRSSMCCWVTSRRCRGDQVLPAPARPRPGRGDRAGRGVPRGRAAREALRQRDHPRARPCGAGPSARRPRSRSGPGHRRGHDRHHRVLEGGRRELPRKGGGADASPADAPTEAAKILRIGARNGLDEAAAAMLAHLLMQRGLTRRDGPAR